MGAVKTPKHRFSEKAPLARRQFSRKAERFLKAIQTALLPMHAKEIVAINVSTGEYVLGNSFVEAADAFDARWPHAFSFVCRVDGGPALRLKSAPRHP